ncbi:ComEC/Rec2 family competence protein [Mycoplasma hafezii]|uniref:ComEC/Rec2 family competence protein n=1 Tax=Mycoplasma hafezii TaxID=525886 RepID=UPI003CE9F50B
MNNYVIYKNEDNQFWLVYQKVIVNGKIKSPSYNNNYDLLLEVSSFELSSTIDPRYYFFKYFYNLSKVYHNFILPVLFGHYLNLNLSVFHYVRELNIVHLLVVSGLHYGIIFGTLVKLTRKFDKHQIIPLILITLFFFFSRITIGSFRSFVLILLFHYFKKIKFLSRLNWNKHYLLFFVSCAQLIINIYSARSTGYYISYILSFFIYSTYTATTRASFKNQTIFLLKIWTISTAIILTNGNSISLFSFLYNFIFAFIIEFIIYILFFGFWILPVCVAVHWVFINFVKSISIINIIFVIEVKQIGLIVYPIIFTLYCTIHKT